MTKPLRPPAVAGSVGCVSPPVSPLPLLLPDLVAAGAGERAVGSGEALRQDYRDSRARGTAVSVKIFDLCLTKKGGV